VGEASDGAPGAYLRSPDLMRGLYVLRCLKAVASARSVGREDQV